MQARPQTTPQRLLGHLHTALRALEMLGCPLTRPPQLRQPHACARQRRAAAPERVPSRAAGRCHSRCTAAAWLGSSALGRWGYGQVLPGVLRGWRRHEANFGLWAGLGTSALVRACVLSPATALRARSRNNPQHCMHTLDTIDTRQQCTHAPDCVDIYTVCTSMYTHPRL